MALKFNDTKGAAIKSGVDTYKYEDGDQSFRIVGDVLARYVYWLKGENNKDIPFECLAFNRDTEAFDNAEKDWVRYEYPNLKCGWAYAVQAIDPKDGKLKVVNLKKKLWAQIMTAAEDLGDPTDTETGWDVVFRKKKTGPLPINVEYELLTLKLKKRPLNDTERAAIAELKSMDQVMPRPTPDQQKELLNKIRNGTVAESIDEEIESEFKID